MTYLEAYTTALCHAGNPQLARSVENTAHRFASEFLDQFDYCSEATALLFGNIQSGKTGQMFGIISAAADAGFGFFVLLTTDNVVLQQQTLERVKRDLPGFCVCDESDSIRLEENDGVLPTIIVLKKNQRTLRHWEKSLRTTRVLNGNPLFILDDEADASSLNTKVNQDDVSRINEYLAKIRANASASVFLQVTGTPQALFLQTEESDWQPSFTLYFDPGDKYLGGNFFFPESAYAPSVIAFTDDDSDPVKTFVVRHLAVSAVQLMAGKTVSNAVVHNSNLTVHHETVAKEIEGILSAVRTGEVPLRDLVLPQLQDFRDRAVTTLDEEQVLKVVEDRVLPTANVIILNGKNEFDRSAINTGCNFIVGGNSLGRGVTFPALNTFLYTRSTKNPQADTVWQHNRIFGYDRDPMLIRVFLPRHLYKLLTDINAANNAVIAQVKAGMKTVKLCYPPSVKPTRKNVLDKKALRLIPGGKNFFPDAVSDAETETLDQLLQAYADKEYDSISLEFAAKLLGLARSKDDGFSTDGYVSILRAILSEHPTASGILIVRRNRNVANTTGALLSSDDWQLANSFPEVPVVTLYRVTGEKGWGGPRWVPNVRLPNDGIYYGLT